MLQFHSLSEFLQMNGHGPYVWACYLIAFVVLAYNVIAPLVDSSKLKAQLLRNYEYEEDNASET